MAKVDIPFLVIKRRGAKLLHYWQPSATLKRSGWKSLSLGADADAAVRKAQARNAEVDAWREGRATRADVRRAVKARSFGQLIDRYKASEAFTDLKPQTRKVYASSLRVLRDWAGDYGLEHITPKRLQALYDALRKPPAGRSLAVDDLAKILRPWAEQFRIDIGEGRMAGVAAAVTGAIAAADSADRACMAKGIRQALARLTNAEITPPAADELAARCYQKIERLHRAHAVMRVFGSLWKFLAAEELVSMSDNPALLVRKKTPPARQDLFPEGSIHVAVAYAEKLVDKLGVERPRPSIGTALLIAHEIGQREADILALKWSQWKNGRIRLRQKKTNTWISVKATAALRERLDALDEANRASDTPSTYIIVNEETGRPYAAETFQRYVRKVLDLAVAGGHDELAGLQYRDLRRTAVVRLGETGMELHLIAAVSGHSIEATKKILEVYLPRTEKMADAAIDMLEAHRAQQKETQG